MPHFTKEQLQELAKFFDLPMPSKPLREGSLAIKDGDVIQSETVWWRAELGPEKVIAGCGHWSNIREFPHLYSHEKPKTKLVYI